VTAANGSGGRSPSLVLAAVIFAVAMTFIDRTVVSIASLRIQDRLGLPNTGVQGAVNAWIGGRMPARGGRAGCRTAGHRRPTSSVPTSRTPPGPSFHAMAAITADGCRHRPGRSFPAAGP
jgi:hypothetical protein